MLERLSRLEHRLDASERRSVGLAARAERADPAVLDRVREGAPAPPEAFAWLTKRPNHMSVFVPVLLGDEEARNLVAAYAGTSGHTLVGDPGVEIIGKGTVCFSVEPALGTHNRRKLVGCLGDSTIERLQGHVASVETIEPERATPD